MNYLETKMLTFFLRRANKKAKNRIVCDVCGDHERMMNSIGGPYRTQPGVIDDIIHKVKPKMKELKLFKFFESHKANMAIVAIILIILTVMTIEAPHIMKSMGAGLLAVAVLALEGWFFFGGVHIIGFNVGKKLGFWEDYNPEHPPLPWFFGLSLFIIPAGVYYLGEYIIALMSK